MNNILQMETSGTCIALCNILYFLSALSQGYAETIECFTGDVSSNGRTSVKSVRCQTAVTFRPVTKCLMFRYQTEADGTQRNNDRLIYGGVGTTWFSCDRDHQCDNYEDASKTWHTNVTIAGRRGDLLCCSSSKCNDPRTLSIPQPRVPCYIGTTVDRKTSGSMQPCLTSQCFNITTGNTTQHKCDMQGLCTKYGLIHNQCKQITEGGVKKYACCCEFERCNLNLVGLVSKQKERRGSPQGTDNQPTVKPMAPMPHDLLPDVRVRQQQKSHVAGIVSAAVLGTALVVLLVIVVFKQWQRYREKYNFSYMQLTADMMVL